MMTLYKSLVVPILDYGSPVLCHIDEYHVNQIERVQRSYTRKLAGMTGLRSLDYAKF